MHPDHVQGNVIRAPPPFPGFSIAEAVDSVACDASDRQDLFGHLGIQGLKRCQGIALDLPNRRGRVSSFTGIQHADTNKTLLK